MHGASALLLGISISLDEFAIRFTLGLLRVPAGLVIVLIALQAFTFSPNSGYASETASASASAKASNESPASHSRHLDWCYSAGNCSPNAGIMLFITVQVGAAASLPRAHQAASELEEGLRLQMPEIADVLVHTEP
jgi:hypothetical protein